MRSHSLKIVSLVTLSALLGFVFPMNVTPTFMLSKEQKLILTQHLQPPPDIPVDAHADAPSAPRPAVSAVPARSAPVAAQAPEPPEETVQVGSYHMRNHAVSRVIAREGRARN